MQYFKGNTHCHSTNSDGEISPLEVGTYYKSCGYDFLSITDHHYLTAVEEYKESGIFPIAGTEFGGVKLADTVGLWVSKSNPQSQNKDFVDGYSVADAYQRNIDNTVSAGGVPILCHPLWHWTFDFDVIKDVTGWKHFELCNVSPDCNSIPIPGYAPAEEMWDKLLSSGRRVFAVASDDAHKYNAPFTIEKSIACRSFIMLKAESLNDDALRESFELGRFYSSTGVELKEFSLDDSSIKVEVDISNDEEICSIEFFGNNGKLLQHSIGSEAKYDFKGDENYVRIRIANTKGFWLWTQPVFLDDLENQKKWLF